PRPPDGRVAGFQPGGMQLRLPRQPVQARSGALADPAGAFCPEPRRTPETRLWPGATAPGGAGHCPGDPERCQSGHLQYPQ
ncbi:hypothetical protein NYY91_18725, partial [Acinetobacter baumannii]|nr:hypothetical protein [Acinetobacter baumannii]